MPPSRVPEVEQVLADLGVEGAGCAVALADGTRAGVLEDELVTPASVMKVQVALTVASRIATGELDGEGTRLLRATSRTPGPVGLSLMRDDVTMSVRDLMVAMLTVSDNVATDELLGIVGVDAVNETTEALGLARTHVVGDLGSMLDGLARELGFERWAALAAHDPDLDGPPTAAQLEAGLAASATLDPRRGTRTTARETASLLECVWTDRAGPPAACAIVRELMGRQLTRHRIASGFDASVAVAAKSGGLFGIVRNEAGVVRLADGTCVAVAVFTRRPPGCTTDGARIDAGIGRVARLLVDAVR